MTTQVVGRTIMLNDSNCQIIKNTQNGGVSVAVNLSILCPSAVSFLDQSQYCKQMNIKPRPEYIKVSISIDLDGDKTVALPDENKRLLVEKYYGHDETTKII